MSDLFNAKQDDRQGEMNPSAFLLISHCLPAVGVQVAAQIRGALVDLHGGVLVAVLKVLFKLGRRGAHLVPDNPTPKDDAASLITVTRTLNSLLPSGGWGKRLQ